MAFACVQATGFGGELRVGHQRAATLGAWSLETASGLPALRFEIAAEIVAKDAFWITQGPFVLDLRFGRFHWLWETISPDVANGRATVLVYGKPHILKDGEV